MYYAAHHRRRELYVGRSSVGSILLNKLAPGLLDKYLAKTGFESQQTPQPASPDRPSNLFHPVPGDHGAHGQFDSRASATSPQLWVDTHRGLMALMAVGLGTLVGAAVRRSRP